MNSSTPWNPSPTSLPAPASAAPDSIAKPPTLRWLRYSPPKPPTSILFGDLPARSKHSSTIAASLTPSSPCPLLPLPPSAPPGSITAGSNTVALGERKPPRPLNLEPRRVSRPQPVRLAMGLSCRFHLCAQPHPARLDQQLRRPPLFPLQSALVCGQLCLHRRAGAMGAPLCCAHHPRAPRPRRTRNQLDAHARFAAAAGPSSRSPACSCCGACATPNMPRLKALSSTTPSPPFLWIVIAAEPYPWNPFRWHVIVETQNFYQIRRGQHAHRQHRQRSADRPAL